MRAIDQSQLRAVFSRRETRAVQGERCERRDKRCVWKINIVKARSDACQNEYS
jgi:hypothetical protein